MKARPAATPAPPAEGRAAQGHTHSRGLVSSSPVFGLKYKEPRGRNLSRMAEELSSPLRLGNLNH